MGNEENMDNMVIEIPAGYVIDHEKSTDAKIVFKKAVSTEPFRSNPDALVEGYYIDKNSIMLVVSPIALAKNTPTNWNVFVTKAQAKSALAMARISQIMKK